MRTRIPQAAARLMALHPNLQLETHDAGDMIEPQAWGVIMSPRVDGVSAYRYMLWRLFNPALPILVVVMLNPSTATHLEDDKTVDGLVRRARRLGYGGVLVVNCFAYRAREPGHMKSAQDPVGEANDDAIVVATSGQRVLCAWGTNANHMGRGERVKCLMIENDAALHHLRLCKNGEPEHPLYVPSALGLTPWPDICANGSFTPTVTCKVS